MNRRLSIGIIGFGTVGSHTTKILYEKRARFQRETGISFEVRRICDLDWKTRRIWMPPANICTTRLDEVLNDPEIDIIVELIGRIEPAWRIITDAMKSGKSVVTANKYLLSEHLCELLQICSKTGSYLGFEASVAGAIPIIKGLKESFAGNRIGRITGILNGTTNYILSAMSRGNKSFREALDAARKLGYAEADPSFDISGKDSAQKLAIISSFAFHTAVTPSDFPVEGIEGIEAEDIRFARDLGYRIKLLAIAARQDAGVQLRVHPALVPSGHLLAGVEDVYNAIYLEGDLLGRSLFYGEGAGGYAASSAVIADIIEIGRKLAAGTRIPEPFLLDANVRILRFENLFTRYYLRFTALDKPGVLAQIARILGKHNISIASVMQKEENPQKAVPILILTHKALEKNIRKAIAMVDCLPVVKAATRVIRVED